MKTLLYKGIEFDGFQLYREADNSGGCEYGYPTDKVIDIKSYEEVNVYICPHCIRKFGLYKETETTEEQIDDVLKSQTEGIDEEWDLTCSISGCKNKDSFDGWLPIQGSRIIEK